MDLKSSVVLVGAMFFLACGGGAPNAAQDEDAAEDTLIETTFNLKGEQIRRIKSEGDWVVFANPYGDGSVNPAQNIYGHVRAYEIANRATLVTLSVRGLPPERDFGAHVHKLVCGEQSGGGHYQNIVSPTTPTDPAYANPQNEVWLDFKSNRHGNGFAFALVHWTFRPDGANSVVVHNQKTAENGTAGPRLACRNVNF